MQIKEFEAFTLKECLQMVRDELGPDAVILETRKFRKGGLLGWGARDAVVIVAGIGIAIQEPSMPASRNEPQREAQRDLPPTVSAAARTASPIKAQAVVPTAHSTPDSAHRSAEPEAPVRPRSNGAALAAARHAYGRNNENALKAPPRAPIAEQNDFLIEEDEPPLSETPIRRTNDSDYISPRLPARTTRNGIVAPPIEPPPAAKLPRNSTDHSKKASLAGDVERMTTLERAIKDIKDALTALQKDQRDSEERTVSAVVSAVVPAVTAAANGENLLHEDLSTSRFPAIYGRLLSSGLSEHLIQEFIDSLPDFSAWSEEAREPLAESSLRTLITNRLPIGGAIELTPGKLKAVALIGPTGVGKTTTIAKLAAHYALMEDRKVAMLTVDTYRIAAVEQLKTYSQIIDIPIGVAYSPSDVKEAVKKFSGYDLLLIDTAGRSQNNILQIGELKTLLEGINCETHLVLSSPVKESDMLDIVHRFSAARVDRIIFTKLDETRTHGTLLNIADQTGIPISYLTNGQKVPEDLVVADGPAVASLVLGNQEK